MNTRIDWRLLDTGRKYSSKPLTEAEDWAKHGCANNEEWHEHLKKEIEKGYTPEEVDGCYVGVVRPIKSDDYD